MGLGFVVFRFSVLLNSSTSLCSIGDVLKIVKVTRKRQITIPKEISEKLEINVGDYVRLYVDEEGNRIIVEKILSLSDLAGVLNPGFPLKGLAEDLDKSRKVGERE